jgi:hypothetical protein
VQVLPRYTRICINLKKYDIETLPFLSSYNVVPQRLNTTTITTSTVIMMGRGSLPLFEMVKNANITLPTE